MRWGKKRGGVVLSQKRLLRQNKKCKCASLDLSAFLQSVHILTSWSAVVADLTLLYETPSRQVSCICVTTSTSTLPVLRTTSSESDPLEGCETIQIFLRRAEEVYTECASARLPKAKVLACDCAESKNTLKARLDLAPRLL